MQVEVSIQDNYHLSSEHQAAYSPELQLSPCPDTWQSWFTAWLTSLNPNLSPTQSYELSLRLTTDVEIHHLNAQYRRQDRPTDVLAFAALEVEIPVAAEQMQLPLYLGDIVISIDTAQRQAEQQGHDLQTELGWLAAHGLLHLLGWDHPDEASLQQMLTEQLHLLQKIGLNPSLNISNSALDL